MRESIDATDFLNRLHYNRKWVEYGFIDRAFLRSQVEELELTRNESTEHYRYAAFRAVLASTQIPDDVTISRFIELAELDEDQTMAQAALALLARDTNLTDDQLERLRGHSAFRTPTLQNIITQNQLLRILDSDQLTDDVFDRCLMIGNKDVQRKLVGRRGLSVEQLGRLMMSGSNRAVRNLAKERVRKQTSLDRKKLTND